MVMPMAKRPTPAQLQKQVDQFNQRWREGQQVSVRMDNGTARITNTRGPAWVLSGHSAVIALEGISGCYLLDRVTPIEGGAA